jgi:pyruvate ferredoxin oxidoreductase alpha subunit/phenylglyoxylate dehydrogenase alpha subunit
MQNALRVITEVHQEWEEKIGHAFAPILEKYRLDDAEYALMTLGSMTGAGKDAVDLAREKGEKVGLVKIKTFRPFPKQAVLDALSKVKAVGVVDRSVNYGWGCGPLYQEVLAALYFQEKRIPALSFIGGLAGTDITLDHFAEVIKITANAAKGDVLEGTTWLNEMF